jgi:hypothetical protein
MGSEWKSLANAEDFATSRSGIEVRFASGRKHAVEVDGDDPKQWRFRSVVASKVAVERHELDPWRMNRTAVLIKYRRDQRGRLVAEAWVPRNAAAEEFQFVVRRLATEADRLELRLTGSDEY